MRPAELVDLGLKKGLFSDRISGSTLDYTMKSKLHTNIRKLGDRSAFVQTQPGKFYLRRLLDDMADIYEAPRFVPPAPSEDVLVFLSSWLDQQGYRFQGITKRWKRIYEKLVSGSIISYMDRLEAESNDNYKQILTYIMITRKNKVLAYKRGTYNQAASFLRGRNCIGFGGHVTAIDADLFGSDDLGIHNCAVREASEELILPDQDKARIFGREGLQIVGLLNDDSSAVGRRHFAFVLRYEVSDDPIWDTPQRGEKSITKLRWIDLDLPSFDMTSFEYWSQLCIQEYYPNAVRGLTSYLVRRKRPFTRSHILCVIGPIGSGKSEATKILCDDFGYEEINSGRVIAELLNIPPVPITPREAFQEAAWNFISTDDGPEKLATALWSRISSYNNPRVLVDGIRQKATIECLQRLANNRKIAVMFVHTPPNIAYNFYNQRLSRDIPIQEFLRVRNAKDQREVDDLITISDIILYNWKGKFQYRNAIRELMREIGIEKI